MNAEVKKYAQDYAVMLRLFAGHLNTHGVSGDYAVKRAPIASVLDFMVLRRPANVIMKLWPGIMATFQCGPVVAPRLDKPLELRTVAFAPDDYSKYPGLFRMFLVDPTSMTPPFTQARSTSFSLTKEEMLTLFFDSGALTSLLIGFCLVRDVTNLIADPFHFMINSHPIAVLDWSEFPSSVPAGVYRNIDANPPQPQPPWKGWYLRPGRGSKFWVTWPIAALESARANAKRALSVPAPEAPAAPTPSALPPQRAVKQEPVEDDEDEVNASAFALTTLFNPSKKMRPAKTKLWWA
jgi:hypothetical protein